MRIFLITLAVIGWVATVGFGQTTTFDVRRLRISWEIIENNHQQKPQFLSALTLRNAGRTALPATGWKIYFNFPRFILADSVTGPVTIRHLNGDLFELAPKPEFKTLAPGATQQITLLADAWAVNITDAPTGFYLVWDQRPQQGLALPRVTVVPSTRPAQYLRSPADKISLTTPAELYAQYQTVRDIPEEKLPRLFPTPVSYRTANGSFKLSAAVPIITPSDFYPEAQLLADDLGIIFGNKPSFGVTGTGRAIRFVKKSSLGPEAYELRVNARGVTIVAATPAGIFYGIQSLKILLPPDSWDIPARSLPVPYLEVVDAPRFAHRAVMLDVARNFQTKKQIMKILDLMALYKLNVLHFHLNDDEGWRLEIKPLPELTEVGARRGHTLDSKSFLPPSYGSGPLYRNPAGSGFYRRADFIQILKYARDRNIKVIPEIETPGHARAAIKAMDARYDRLMIAGQPAEAAKYLLRDRDDQSQYRSVQNWNDNIINVAMPSVYTFLETVVDEVRSMYEEAGAPLTTIHMGGDEVPAGVWEKSPVVQSLMAQDERFTSVDDLWYYYYRKVNDMLRERKLLLSGWEEVALRKTQLEGQKHYIPNPDFVNDEVQVDVWNNVLGWGSEDLAYRLANAGYKVVLSNVTHLYFDMAYQKAFDEPGYYWGAYTDVEQPFSFVPFNYYQNTRQDRLGNQLGPTAFLGKDKLTDFGKQNIVGIQGLLWSETITSPGQMEYMLLPKLLGLAERAWAPEPTWATEKDTARSAELYRQRWSQFANIIGKNELPRLEYYAGGYQYRVPPAGAVVQNGAVVANVAFPGFFIRYTTDGTTPTVRSKEYTKPIRNKGTIKLRVFSSDERGSRVMTVVNK